MSEINDTNEIKEQDVKNEVKKECNCCCKEFLKKVGVIALGTFIGVYSGLSLFAVTHKPKFNAPIHYQIPYGGHHMHNHHHGHHVMGPKHFNGDFKGAPGHFKGDFKGMPNDFEGKRPNFEGKKVQ